MLSHKVRLLFALAMLSGLAFTTTFATKAIKSTSGRSSSDTAGKAAPLTSTTETSSSSSTLPATGNAASVAGIATMLSSLGSFTSMVPGMLSNAVPVVLMMGLGALLVPVLGLDSLLRVMKRRSMPSISNGFLSYINTVQDVLQKVTTALDRMEKLYGH